MFKKGNRLFSAATLTLLLVAGLHTLGIFRQPAAGEEAHLIESMKNYGFQGLGMTWSIHDVLISVLLTMTVLMVFMATVNFYFLYALPSLTVRRHVCLIDAIFMWILAVLYAIFQIPPPFVSFALLGILFTACYLVSTKSEEPPSIRNAK